MKKSDLKNWKEVVIDKKGRLSYVPPTNEEVEELAQMLGLTD